jgi:drug/metabolite transporter (DMT)-like permease
MQTVTYSILFGTVMLCLAAWMQTDIPLSAVREMNTSQIISLLYLGALGSALAYIWYYDAIKKIGATRSGVFIALNPLTAVVLGYFLLGEHINIMMGIGGLVIFIGIVLNNWPSQPIVARKY